MLAFLLRSINPQKNLSLTNLKHLSAVLTKFITSRCLSALRASCIFGFLACHPTSPNSSSVITATDTGLVSPQSTHKEHILTIALSLPPSFPPSLPLPLSPLRLSRKIDVTR